MRIRRIIDRIARDGAEGTALALDRERKDGTTFPVEVRGRAVEIDGRHFSLGGYRDVSQRKAHAAVVTAMVMPGMDGPTLVRTLHCVKPELPVPGMTGFGERVGLGRFEALALPATKALDPANHRGRAPETDGVERIPGVHYLPLPATLEPCQ